MFGSESVNPSESLPHTFATSKSIWNELILHFSVSGHSSFSFETVVSGFLLEIQATVTNIATGLEEAINQRRLSQGKNVILVSSQQSQVLDHIEGNSRITVSAVGIAGQLAGFQLAFAEGTILAHLFSPRLVTVSTGLSAWRNRGRGNPVTLSASLFK